ncbi:hypothetical protein FHW88_003819 [Mucilaginibacter sp. SG538B]|nr:hypothetical protein [Mucilaginibacter sp. SG538B]
MTVAAGFGLNENALNFSIKGICMYFNQLNYSGLSSLISG